MCLLEPPHALGKLNAASGFVWALTLVNLRYPEIFAAFLKHHQAGLPHDDAFFNGLFSALVIWLESAPMDSSVSSFLEYHPGWQDPSLPQLWDRYMRQACNDALHFHQSTTITDIGALFRYQPISSLVG